MQPLSRGESLSLSLPCGFQSLCGAVFDGCWSFHFGQSMRRGFGQGNAGLRKSVTGHSQRTFPAQTRRARLPTLHGTGGTSSGRTG